MEGSGRELRTNATVRSRRPGLAAAVFVAAAAGVGMLAAWVAGAFSWGFLGLYVVIGAALARSASAKRNWGAEERQRELRVDAAGVSLGGVLAVPRARIADGYLLASGALRLVDRARSVLLDIELERAEGILALELLGLDAARHRVELRVEHTLPVGLQLLLGALALLTWLVSKSTAVVGNVSLAMALAVAAPLLVARYLPASLVIGIDGVQYRALGGARFIPMADIASVAALSGGRIELRLASGGRQTITVASGGKDGPSPEDVAYRDMVVRRIEGARAAFRSRTGTTTLTAMLERGGRTADEWLAHLRDVASRRGAYRESSLRDGDLVELAADPAAPEDARAAAALLLRSGATDDGEAARERIRVAASATASPRLRVALEAAADADDASAVEGAVAELARAAAKR